MHRTTTSCERCGVEFSYYRYTRPRIYCSDDCRKRIHREACDRWEAKNPGYRAARQRAYRAADPEKYRERCRRFRVDNPDYRRNYYQANRDRERKLNRTWQKLNPHLARECQRRWREAHPERYAESQRKWYASGAGAAKSRLRRARKRAAPYVPFTHAELVARLAMWPGCWVCGGPKQAVDHVKPIARGGAHALCNLRPICTPCNSSKRDRWPFVPQQRR